MGLHYHFVGIGGAGMSGLARVLLELGHEVSGSDKEFSVLLERLGQMGARVFSGHNPDNIEGADVLVVSSAVPKDNEELAKARCQGIPILHRADLLADLMDTRQGIAVAGCHGKTTTTSMISVILLGAGLDPTILVGAELEYIGGNAKLGRGPYLVAEADESDGSFLKLKPHVAVVTNIEDDHLEHYGGRLCGIIEAFRQFIGLVPPDGAVVLSGDDPNLGSIARELKGRVITYSLDGPADYRACNVLLEGMGSSFDVTRKGRKMGRVHLGVPGVHNVANAMAALAVGSFLNVDFSVMARALKTYKGARRRFQTVAIENGVRVVDDYAHHPTEVKATIGAARVVAPGRIICVFQPHRYTRTRLLSDMFGPAFQEADEVIVAPIYSAGEEPIPGVDSRVILESVARNTRVSPRGLELDEIPSAVAAMARPGDIVLLLGAGNIGNLAGELVSNIKEHSRGGDSGSLTIR